MKWEQELKIAKEAAVLAGKKIMEVYEQEEMEIELKKDDSPLTLADKYANQIIMDMLRKGFPEYAILSEEEQDNLERLKNDYCFIVDPLDGTKEFIKRNGQFTVNIGLSYKNKVILGVIYVPVSKKLYYATEGQGAYLLQDQKIKKLSVSERTKDARVVISNSHGCKEMDEFIKENGIENCIKMGSSLKGCIIAEGNAELYYRFNPTMEWDTAAMQCIVEEAGGIFYQLDDTLMYYNRINSKNEKGFYILNSIKNKKDFNR